MIILLFSPSPVPATLDLIPTAGGDGVVWSGPLDPDKFPVQLYEVEYRGGQCDAESVDSANLSASNVSISYTDLGLEKGGSYSIRVRSVNVLTAGAWSEQTEINTPGNSEFCQNKQLLLL